MVREAESASRTQAEVWVGEHSVSCWSEEIRAEKCYHQCIKRIAIQNGNCSVKTPFSVDNISTKYGPIKHSFRTVSAQEFLRFSCLITYETVKSSTHDCHFPWQRTRHVLIGLLEVYKSGQRLRSQGCVKTEIGGKAQS